MGLLCFCYSQEGQCATPGHKLIERMRLPSLTQSISPLQSERGNEHVTYGIASVGVSPHCSDTATPPPHRPTDLVVEVC